MTVLKNLTLPPIKLLGKTPEEAEAKAMSLLERVGLADRGSSYPHSCQVVKNSELPLHGHCMDPE